MRDWPRPCRSAELRQHECDHLDGILAVSRAVGPRAFALASELPDPPPRPVPVR